MDLNYSYYKNSEKIQMNQQIGVDFNSIFSNYKDESDLLIENLGYEGSAYFLSENRFYFKPGRFIETDLLYNGNMYISSQKNFPEITEVSVNEFNVSIPIIVGFGRIEQVQDCRLALYIFDELNKVGRLNRIPTNDEIFYVFAVHFRSKE
ncbi:MAG: hypothetical protein MZV49_11495 [Rhodopseudomonas palustris]|nr:hypothetical protein [Rhodopseudomonas palustris]